MSEICLCLPFPPTMNHYWLRTRNGGLRLSDAGEVFREEATLIGRHAGTVSGRLEVWVTLQPPDHRIWDLDNRLKPVLDALQHSGVIENDGHIDKLHVERADVNKGNGVCLVRIRSIG